MRAMCYGFRHLTLFTAALALALCGCSSAPEQKPAPAKKAEAPRVMPEVYKVRFETTKGPFVVEVHKDWAPRGAERFWKLVGLRFFDNSKIFRVKRNFVVQFGVSPDPSTNAVFNNMPIDDDPVKESNVEGTLAFAADGKNTRRTQVFVNLTNNKSLDKQGFAPFAKLVEGRLVFEALFSGYGEMAPIGHGPDPSKLAVQGNAYADAQFPRLDAIVRARVVD